jgi:protein-disulfide reductase (glutathione)
MLPRVITEVHSRSGARIKASVYQSNLYFRRKHAKTSSTFGRVRVLMMSFARGAAALFVLISMLAPVRSAQAAPELADAWNAPAIIWHELKTGIPEATKTGKTVVMVFHASWCTACKTYREVFKDPAVVAASKSFVMILIDGDKDKMANGAFSPDGTYVPRTIFLTPDGDVRKDLTGKTDPQHPHTIDIESPAELLSLMTKAAGGASPTPSADPDQRAAN